MTATFDTLRALLLDMERWPNQFKYRIQTVTVDGADDAVVNALIHQLLSAGYVEGHATVNRTSGTRAYIPTRLTIKGHSLLNAVRSDDVCAKVRAATVDTGDSVPPGFLAHVAAVVAEQRPGLYCSCAFVATGR